MRLACMTGLLAVLVATAAWGQPATMASTVPASSPAGTGTVDIRAVQGTKDGPAISGGQVIVEALVDERPVRWEARLDGQGRASVSGLPLSCEALVTIVHEGITYRQMAGPFTREEPRRQVEIPVYEASEQEPAWVIKMRHVMLQNSVGGVVVTQMLAVENPGDRAWRGKRDGTGKPATLVVSLPRGAVNPRVGGAFDEDHTEVAAGAIVSRAALVPGVTQYQFQYELPASGGHVHFDLDAPAAVRHTMVMAPEDGTAISSELLQPAQAPAGMGARARLFMAGPLGAGQVISIGVSGLENLKPGTVVGGDKAASGGLTALRLMGGFVAALIVIVGGGVVLARKPDGAR